MENKSKQTHRLWVLLVIVVVAIAAWFIANLWPFVTGGSQDKNKVQYRWDPGFGCYMSNSGGKENDMPYGVYVDDSYCDDVL